MLHIVTDSDCDLPREILDQYGIRVFPMSVTFGKEKYWDDGESLDREAFYSRLARPPFPRTGPPELEYIRRVYLDLARDGGQILSLHVSPKLSLTLSRAKLIADGLADRADIEVLDTRAGSLAQGMLVYRAAVLAGSGAGREQIKAVIENLTPQSNAVMTVNNLDHLVRGGRLSRAAALIANTMALKPLIRLTDEGALAPFERAHGWNRAVDTLFKCVETRVTYARENPMGVIHSRLPEEAGALAEELRRRFEPRELIVSEFGPSIGTHVGPGALGVIFYSEHGREQK